MRGGGLNPHKDGEALWDLVFNQREAILATLKRDGRPQLSNVLYVVDPDSRTVRISTTSERAKARNLGRDPRAALHVSGDNFWSYAVAEGQATLSPVARTMPARSSSPSIPPSTKPCSRRRSTKR
jgi:PPOX class probable F420-dependent enzyme